MTSDTPAASKPTAEAPADVLKREWHRSDNLIYTLEQGGWRGGKPVMVNGFSVRVEGRPFHTAEEAGKVAEAIHMLLVDRAARPSAAPADVREAGEPVAWRWRWPARYGCEEDWFPVKHTGHVPHGAEAEPLYAAAIHPPAQDVEGAPSGDAVRVAKAVCHDEQMTIWTGDIAGDLSIAGYLREDLDYEDVLGVHQLLAGQIANIVEAAFNLATPSPAVAGLRAALQDCIETLALVEHETRVDPQHGDEVERLGRRIGFGALMSSAQASWRKSLADGGWPAGGEFVAGPCFATVQGTLRRARAAIAAGSGIGGAE